LPFGLAAVAVFLWWSADEGGYAPTAWYPGAIVFLGLVGVVALRRAELTSLGRWGRRALAFFAAFTAWSFLSLLWAGVKGDAWDGANRTMLYLTVYAAFALLRWRTRDAAVVIGLFALGTAAIGAAAFAGEGASALADGRLAAPTGYANASAALFLAAFWPAVGLAARAEVYWPVRGLLLGAGGVLLQLAVLAQSRGSVVAGGIALLVYLALSRRRARALVGLIPVAAVTLLSLGPLLDVFDSATQAELEDAVARERLALALSAAALFFIGAFLAWLDRPDRFSAGARFLTGRRRAGWAAVTAAGAVLALAAAVGTRSVTAEPGPPDATSESGSALRSSRFGDGLETGRYELWRVAAGEVAEHPALGVGVDNFAVDFAKERRTREEPLYPHSLLLRAFSQTGLVGGGLFLGFLAAGLAAALQVRRRADTLTNAIGAAAVASAVYWVVQGSIDWFWEIPALAGPALALLGLAHGLRDPRPVRPLTKPLRSPRALTAAGLLCAAVAASYLLPGLAAFEVERAVKTWPDSPARAFSRLEWARRLNPLSERPDLIAGTLAQRAGEAGTARAAFGRVLERNPSDWYAHLRLALLDARTGRRSQALAHLERARSLNPLEPALDEAERALALGRRPPPELLLRLEQAAIPFPLGRRPVDCRPVLGLGRDCT
jgi:tetratricopeptide (TPR) repeat protein